MPVDVSQFYHLLDQFQDTAVEPERWPLLMESISSASGAAGLNIMAPAGRSSVCGLLFSDSPQGSWRRTSVKSGTLGITGHGIHL